MLRKRLLAHYSVVIAVFIMMIASGPVVRIVYGDAPHSPHHGYLVEAGEEFAYIELVLNPKAGSLAAYILDRVGEQPIRIEQPAIHIVVDEVYYTTKKKDHFITDLIAVPNLKKGETVGDASEFAVFNEPKFQNAVSIKARIIHLNIKPHSFQDLPFRIRLNEKPKT